MGYQKNGTPRYKRKNCEEIFKANYLNDAGPLDTKKLIVKMSTNSNEVTDVSKILTLSKDGKYRNETYAIKLMGYVEPL